jgi:hypothetical protein
VRFLAGYSGDVKVAKGILLINESPIGNVPSEEMRVDGSGHVGCSRWVCGGMEGVKGALLLSFVGRLTDKPGGE